MIRGSFQQRWIRLLKSLATSLLLICATISRHNAMQPPKKIQAMVVKIVHLAKNCSMTARTIRWKAIQNNNKKRLKIIQKLLGNTVRHKSETGQFSFKSQASQFEVRRLWYEINCPWSRRVCSAGSKRWSWAKPIWRMQKIHHFSKRNFPTFLIKASPAWAPNYPRAIKQTLTESSRHEIRSYLQSYDYEPIMSAQFLQRTKWHNALKKRSSILRFKIDACFLLPVTDKLPFSSRFFECAVALWLKIRVGELSDTIFAYWRLPISD